MLAYDNVVAVLSDVLPFGGTSLTRCQFATLVLLTVSTVVLPVHAEPGFNLSQSFADTKRILQDGGQADVIIFGDSLTFGVYPTLREQFQSVYGNAGAGYQPVSRWTGAGFDRGWHEGQINADTAPHRGLDGLYAQSTGVHTGGFLDLPGKDVELHYVASPGGGKFTTYNGFLGATIADIDTNSPTNAVKTWNHTLTVNQLGFYQENPNVTLLGVNNKTATPGLRLHRAANGGWGVENFLQRDWTFDAQLPLLSPDLAFIWLGTNDPEFSREQYKEYVGRMVDRIRAAVPDTEIVLIGNYDVNYNSPPGVVYGVEDLARERGLGFINFYETAGTYQSFVENGWLRDAVHFSETGDQHMSQLLVDAFRTDGASLVPEPGSFATAVLCTGIAVLRRRRRG